MIRYEIYSNVASSEHGLQGYPALQELVDNLHLSDIEARLVRQVQREEDEINIASSHFARGVKVRSVAVKSVAVEASLRGLYAWLRSASARVDRGVHVDIEKVRLTNGAPLVMGPLLAAGQHAFVSGLDDTSWVRLVTVPDWSLKRIPEPLASNAEACGEYLSRRGRPSGFWPMLAGVLDLNLLPVELLPRLLEAVRTRDAKVLMELTDAQVANIGLIADGLERYQKLVEQGAAALQAADVSTEAANLFEVLALDVPFPDLQAALLPFVLEAARERVPDLRQLIHEARIGLNNGQGTSTALGAALLPLIVRTRLEKDPLIYGKSIRLAARDPDLLAAQAPMRKLYLELAAGFAEEPQPLDPEGQLAPHLKQLLFEAVVQLTLQAQYTHTFRNNVVPVAAQGSRDLLAVIVFRSFNIAQLKTLHPSMPAKGVARSLAEKTSVTNDELRAILEALEKPLYPLAELSARLARQIHKHFSSATQQRKLEEVHRYVRGGVHLLHFSRYLLGRSQLDGLTWRALLRAGNLLGLTMHESRDQVRDHGAPGPGQQESDFAMQGTVMLMTDEDSRLLPLRARPELLLLAYRYLLRLQVAFVVRRFVARKLNYLFMQHGSRLFTVLYRHITWDAQLQISRWQLAEILTQEHVLDKERLAEFGFDAKEGRLPGEADNPWLPSESGEHKPPPLAGAAYEQSFSSAQGGFHAAIEGFAPVQSSKDGLASCEQALRELCGPDDIFHVEHPAARERLAACREAEVLARVLLAFMVENRQAMLEGQETAEALLLHLPGDLAYLTQIRDSYPLSVADSAVLLRLVPAPEVPWPAPEGTEHGLDARSVLLATHLQGLLGATKGPGVPLARAIAVLKVHRRAWMRLVDVSTMALLDQILRGTLLNLVVPRPPLAADLASLPEGHLMCLGPSSFNQAKFHRILPRPDRKDAYMTLSEMAGWLVRLQRLREELRYYRDIVADIRGIIANLNVSVYEGAYIHNFSATLGKLDEALSVLPEELRPEHLGPIQERARAVSKLLREIYEQERPLRLRDRWLSRTIIRLKRVQPNARVNFADTLWEQHAPPPAAPAGNGRGEDAKAEAQEAPQEGRVPDYQTFGERLRQAADFLRRMHVKRVFVLSPNSSQRALTLNLIDQLFRLKGLYLPILVDTSNCESFVDVLRTRLPPHRFFDLNAL